MAEAWYSPEDLKAEALGAQRQPEFDREVETDPEDTSWEKMQALIDRMDEIAAIIAADITQSYPTVSNDFDVTPG